MALRYCARSIWYCCFVTTITVSPMFRSLSVEASFISKATCDWIYWLSSGSSKQCLLYLCRLSIPSKAIKHHKLAQCRKEILDLRNHGSVVLNGTSAPIGDVFIILPLKMTLNQLEETQLTIRWPSSIRRKSYDDALDMLLIFECKYTKKGGTKLTEEIIEDEWKKRENEISQKQINCFPHPFRNCHDNSIKSKVWNYSRQLESTQRSDCRSRKWDKWLSSM